MLFWMFFAHRDGYPAVRATFALTIAGCITIQALVPLAPPRFLPDLGFVDAGLAYNMSVYGTGGDGLSNEVSAMPSLHWAWAIIVAVVVWRFAAGRWRWLGVAHLVLTAAAVTLTANHWWLDGAVSGVIAAIAYLLQRWVRDRWRALRGPATPYDDLGIAAAANVPTADVPTPDVPVPDVPIPDVPIPDVPACP
ncbi:MAG TPA: phosphatase PAP2 family protein [Ilumatobacteraceae bacterium]|nr:phosphatase PAP2 family protein [Ilumatobacteraceae bacterium]